MTSPIAQHSFPALQAESPLHSLIQDLIADSENHLRYEKTLQLALNRGVIPTAEDHKLLHSHGYAISYNPETLERFRTFNFPSDPEHTQAIQSAIPEGGLLVDRYKMYRPGPASASACQGAAKGYDEIFALFESQTTEKQRISESICSFIQAIENRLPDSHSWKDPKVLIDLGCGNGVQAQGILKQNTSLTLIGLDNQPGCIASCERLLPKHRFEVHDLFAPAPVHLQGKANILLLSHFYCRPDKISQLIDNLNAYQSARNTLLIFVNGCYGSDGDRLANSLSFLRGKATPMISDAFKKELETRQYTCFSTILEAKLRFPPLTPEIRSALLNIKRGDYENPYPHIDPDVKIYKGLMEFIASFPLESMTQEEINHYLNELEALFQENQGSHLKICNQILFVHSPNTDPAFRSAFEHAQIPETFAQLREKLRLGFYKEGKDALGKLLKKLDMEKKLPESLEGFELMSDFHLNTQHPEAAALLWYTKYLGSTEKERLDTKLDAIERHLLETTTARQGPLRGIAQSHIDKAHLEKLRAEIKDNYETIKGIQDRVEKAQALRQLFLTITQKIKKFIDVLCQDVIDQLQEWNQPLPCQYALIGLGSLAREEVTPYSDFEFAILIDSETEENKDYFRLFTTLLHLRFINLGETILRALDIRSLRWIYDAITPRGLSFDGSMPTACKTPLGKRRYQKGDFELIHTPHEMSQFQRLRESEPQEVLKEYHLPTILSTVTHVCGSQKLVTNYQHNVRELLQSGLGKERAHCLMKEDLLRLKPRLEEEDNGKHYNVKKDLYRLPSIMFDGLASYYGLKSSSSWDRIEELHQRNILTTQAAQDLKELVIFSQELRLSTYLHHGRQKEHLDLDSYHAEILKLYYCVLPFTETMEAFCEKLQKEDPSLLLQKERFYRKTAFYKGLVQFRHMRYQEAYASLTEEKLDSLEYDQILASVANILAHYKHAEESYQRAIEKTQDVPTKVRLHEKLGLVQQKAGRYKDAEKTFFKTEHLLLSTLSSEQSGQDPLLERIYRTLASFYFEFGAYDKAREYLRKCKEISKQRTRGKALDPEYGIVLDLDLAATKKLESKFLDELDSKFAESAKLLQEARQIFVGFYRREDHPTVINCGVQGTSSEEKLGQYEQSLSQTQKVLELRLKIFGDFHPDVATSYDSVGSELSELGRHQEALELHQKALDLRVEVFGYSHPDVAESYNNVGVALSKLGHHQEALKMKQKARNLSLKIFGNSHPSLVTFCNNVGNSFSKLGHHQEALKLQKKGHNLSLKIFGDSHPDVATSCNNVAYTLSKLGRHQEALELQQKALDLRLKIFGNSHPHVAVSYSNVAYTLSDLGCHQKALEMCRKALDLELKVFGDSHPDVAESYNDVGSMLSRLGHHQEALEMEQKALELKLEIFGDSHPDVAVSYYNVGYTLSKLGHHQKAFEMCKNAYSIGKKVHGKFHARVKFFCTAVGNELSELGKLEEALSMHKEALEISKKKFGLDHPETKSCRRNVGITLHELDSKEKARNYLRFIHKRKH